jgi:hypothetical protein
MRRQCAAPLLKAWPGVRGAVRLAAHHLAIVGSSSVIRNMAELKLFSNGERPVSACLKTILIDGAA